MCRLPMPAVELFTNDEERSYAKNPVDCDTQGAMLEAFKKLHPKQKQFLNSKSPWKRYGTPRNEAERCKLLVLLMHHR